MKLKSLAALGVVLFLLVGSVVSATAKADEERSDLWLKARLVTAYALNEHLNPFKLDVAIKDGVAQLSGTVDSTVERDLAVEIAKGIKGIREVKAEIKIEPGIQRGARSEPEWFRTVKDATVTAKVKSKLLWNRNTNGLEIDVSTDGGVVTLKGEVASDAQRELAVLLAKNTTGVQRVKDRLEVVPEAKKSAEKGPLATLKAETSDAWISSKVQSMLLFSKETEGAEIDVSTTGQVVTLKGTVSSKQQEQEILNLVASVTGVTGVRSELIVEQ